MGQSEEGVRLQCDRICIIGAGPSGLTAAKYFKAEKAFSVIDVYEQRAGAGGLWQYTPETEGDGTFHVPQTDPHYVEQPIWESSVVKRKTNIPHSLMGYSDTSWPPDIQLFPYHSDVQTYLSSYAHPVLPLITFATHVQDVRPASDNTWSVTFTDLRTNATTMKEYDAVIVATGHYNAPYIPPIPGLKQWNTAHPGTITHSKHYRHPSSFAGKKIIVIGNGPSGLDISSQLAPSVLPPLLLSSKSANPMAAAFAALPTIENVPEITGLDPKTRTATFADGRKEGGVDGLLFCTGYLYTAPFLASLEPRVIESGLRVRNTYLHMVYAPAPTLCFLALNQRVIPFPLAEAQAAVLARICSGRLSLPSKSAMLSWDAEHLAEVGGEESAFHNLGCPRDADYINGLVEWASIAERRDGLENEGRGKMAKYWGPRECWMRERFPAIRRAFVGMGEARRKIGTLEDLGFVFDGGEVQGNGVREDKGAL